MSDAEAAARFEALQRKLVPLWTSIQTFTQDPQTIVVVPSITLDSTIRGARQQAYEERFLFLLLLLRQPRARLIYVTSQAIHADIVVPFNTTPLERDLALALGIPMYRADPKHPWLGGKSGARRIFAEEGVPHPLGIEDLHSAADLATAIVEMRARKATIGEVVVKLNEGVSGEGNAHLDLNGLPATGLSVDAVTERLQALRFGSSELSSDTYFATLADRGGIVEERIVGSDFCSPSAQLRVTPLGKVEALSTHDQVLGGPSGQSYLGCRFQPTSSTARRSCTRP